MQVEDTCEKIVDASIAIHKEVLGRFLPSAVKFTYNWNMRELTNIFQVPLITQHTHDPDDH
jgi:dynein heavy chain, axonemal